MARARDGSREALDALCRHYQQPLWAFFKRRVRDAGAAEDLAQTVFAALVEAAPRYQPRGRFRSYLFAIAYNVLMADRRKRTFDGEAVDPELAHAPHRDPDAVIWVRRALARLDPDDREIVMLREYDQLSYQEIADVRALPVNTVRSQLFRARLALRQALAPDTVGEGRTK